MKKHSYAKDAAVKGEVRSVAELEVPNDDLDVTAGKKAALVNGLHPRCGIDRDDAEARDEIEAVEP